MADQQMKRGIIVSNFNVSDYEGLGAERKFVAGVVETLPAGVFDNFEHAGLVRAVSAADGSAVLSIVEAVTALNPTNDDHWTNSGLPAVDAVRALLGADVSRAQIEAEAPGITRPEVQPVD